MHRFSPRKADSKWSASNRERAERMERAGLMTAAGRAAVRSAKRSGKWNAPAPGIDLSVPKELAEKLQRDAVAAEFFESLAPSYQRQYIGWIATAKRPETRERRLNEAIALLRRGEKLGMR
jgi:uncharacterized protein YdeI (YjbR/CyaY-like superfamily)